MHCSGQGPCITHVPFSHPKPVCPYISLSTKWAVGKCFLRRTSESKKWSGFHCQYVQFWRILFNHTCTVTEFSSFLFLFSPLTPWMKYHNCPQPSPSLIYTVFTFYTFGEISGILFLCLASTELSITSSWSLLRLMSIESVMPSNSLILFIPFSFRLQSFPASGSFPVSQFFIRWPK